MFSERSEGAGVNVLPFERFDGCRVFLGLGLKAACESGTVISTIERRDE